MSRYRKPIAILGILAGGAALALIAIVGDTFGLPGSAEYVIYEHFNRSMAVLLGLQAFSLVGYASSTWDLPGRIERRLSIAAVAAWAAMALGTAAEFWLYSDLPYPSGPADFNMRTAAFSLFFFGSLAAGAAFLVLGLRLLKSKTTSWVPAILLLLHGPLFIAFFFTDPSIFVAPAISSMVAGGLAMGWGRKPSTHEYKAA